MIDTPPAIVIAEDLGGRVGDYIMAVAQARKSGARIEIKGPCASSCTIWTSLPPDHICVGPQAGLGFHKTSPDSGDAVLMAYYPQAIKQWIDGSGGLTTDVRWLFGSKLRAMFKACGK